MALTPRAARIEEMLAKSPEDSFLLYGLAMEYVRAGESEEGIGRLTQLVGLHPDYHAAYQQLGLALSEQGRDDEAREWLARGVSEATKAGDTHAAGEMAELLSSL